MGSNKPKYLRPEDVAEHMRPFVDFDKQELRKRSGGKRSELQAWIQCPDCKQWRWLALRKLRLGAAGMCKSTHCHACAARQALQKLWPIYEGWYDSNGYRHVPISRLVGRDRELAEAMRTSCGGAVAAHRLVAACCLGRSLSSGEHVHHLDGVRDGNAPDNLMVVSRTLHYHLTQLERLAACEALTMFTADGVPYTVRARVVLERVE